MLAQLLVKAAMAGEPVWQTLKVYERFTLTLSMKEAMIVGAVFVIGLIAELLGIFIRKTIPVTGTLYAASQGYVISFIVFKVLTGYEYLGLEALLLTMVHEGPRVSADPDNYDARANIMWAGMMAHNNSCGVGRTQDWNSHNIEHELSALYDCAHGAGLAVTMPAVFTYVMNHDVMRFAQVAVRVWGCQMDFAHPEVTAKAGIEALRFLPLQ